MADPAVQSNAVYQSGGATCVIAFGSNNTAGNTIVVGAWSRQDIASFTISDSAGNTYGSAVQFLGPGSVPGSATTSIGLWVINNIKAGANTVTVTATGGSGSTEIIGNILELPATTGVTVSNSNTGTAATATVSLSGTTTNDYVVAWCISPTGSLSTPFTVGSNSGFTESNLFSLLYMWDGYSSGGAISCTCASSANWGIIAVDLAVGGAAAALEEGVGGMATPGTPGGALILAGADEPLPTSFAGFFDELPPPWVAPPVPPTVQPPLYDQELPTSFPGFVEEWTDPTIQSFSPPWAPPRGLDEELPTSFPGLVEEWADSTIASFSPPWSPPRGLDEELPTSFAGLVEEWVDATIASYSPPVVNLAMYDEETFPAPDYEEYALPMPVYSLPIASGIWLSVTDEEFVQTPVIVTTLPRADMGLGTFMVMGIGR